MGFDHVKRMEARLRSRSRHLGSGRPPPVLLPNGVDTNSLRLHELYKALVALNIPGIEPSMGKLELLRLLAAAKGPA
jgi:hypothetical protein